MRFGIALLSSTLLASTPYTAAFAQDASEDEVGIQDIIVTAQKREENLQDMQISIVALGSDALEQKRPCIDHLADAALEALADAGLTRDDIDEITSYSGRSDTDCGMSPIGCTEVRDALGLETRWHSGSLEGPAQMSPLMIATMAVS